MRIIAESILFCLLIPLGIRAKGRPVYPSNPYTFPIAERVAGDPTLGSIGDQFFAVDVTQDGLPDFTFRSENRLYVYDHTGTLLWSYPVSPPGGNGGAKHAAADIDGDGSIEIVALDQENRLWVFDGLRGSLKRRYGPYALGPSQRPGHVMIANLRGKGDRDAVIQTRDMTEGYQGIGYYLNRTLIAVNLETGEEIWRVLQDADPGNGIYEGYWGQGHGPAFCADVDGDGIDEVVGGNLIRTENGQARILSLGYPNHWVLAYPDRNYVDHFDAIGIADVRPDLPGLEWVLLEENDTRFSDYHTTLLSPSGILWRVDASALIGLPDFPTSGMVGNLALEPQNIAAGNFDPDRPGREIWNRSRLGGENGASQYPWVYDAWGRLIAHYRMDRVLPMGFNTHPLGNAEGIEMIWTIDWEGGPKEFIAAKTRHVSGNVGIFDAMTGAMVFGTGMGGIPSVRATMVYVADVSGDTREELLLCDSTATGYVIRIYQNSAPTQAPTEINKWEDPLYRRLKQNWNYYAPGGYSRPERVFLSLRVFLEGFVSSPGRMRTTLRQDGWLPSRSPYPEDPQSLESLLPEGVDWVLIRLYSEETGLPSATTSGLLLADGRVVPGDDPDEPLGFAVASGRYRVSVSHRNHLTLVSFPISLKSYETAALDLTSPPPVSNPHALTLVQGNIYAAAVGDLNGDGVITLADRNRVWQRLGERGYLPEDMDGDGSVTQADIARVIANRNRERGL